MPNEAKQIVARISELSESQRSSVYQQLRLVDIDHCSDIGKVRQTPRDLRAIPQTRWSKDELELATGLLDAYAALQDGQPPRVEQQEPDSALTLDFLARSMRSLETDQNHLKHYDNRPSLQSSQRQAIEGYLREQDSYLSDLARTLNEPNLTSDTLGQVVPNLLSLQNASLSREDAKQLPIDEATALLGTRDPPRDFDAAEELLSAKPLLLARYQFLKGCKYSVAFTTAAKEDKLWNKPDMERGDEYIRRGFKALQTALSEQSTVEVVFAGQAVRLDFSAQLNEVQK